mmetsp:Transcript_10378/g.26340  ORF Transcript_10378/g.26340 Transcript_10378/m.26340 type:complete len:342 (-) Transcript_10378:770-1795(-)
MDATSDGAPTPTRGITKSDHARGPGHAQESRASGRGVRFRSRAGGKPAASRGSGKGRGDVVYEVAEGDTLWDIARDLRVPVEDLLEANGGGARILPGERFHIPVNALIRPRRANWGDAIGLPGKVRGQIRDVSARPLGDRGGRAQFWGAFYVSTDAESHRGRREVRRLLCALRAVETSTCPLPAPAGDNGTSIGPLQISHGYHSDAWGLDPRSAGAHARWLASCQGVAYSELTCLRYWMRWCPWALAFGDTEALARTHNGGPSFQKAVKTARYWRKVQGEMDAYDFGTKPQLGTWRRERATQYAYSHYVPWECRRIFECRNGGGNANPIKSLHLANIYTMN